MLTRALVVFFVFAAFVVAGFVVTSSRVDESLLDEATSPADTIPAQSTATLLAPPTSVAQAPVLSSVLPVPVATTAIPPTSVPAAAEAVPRSGSGELLVAATAGDRAGTGELIEYSVAVEVETNLDPDEIAQFVEAVLADPRSWIAEGDLAFQRVPQGGLFTVVIATAETIDTMCVPLRTNSYFSCARNGWVALNLNRWMSATDSWTAELIEYRNYVVNHEIGHYLGRPHVQCPGSGQLAPVMMQQTKGLGNCEPNGWPYP